MKTALLLLLTLLLTSCLFDAKDQCLDAGGSFDGATGQCMRAASGSADTATGHMTETVSGASFDTLPALVYPSNATDNVAARWCLDRGGALSTEYENGVDVLYCEVEGEKQDAWKLFTDQQ